MRQVHSPAMKTKFHRSVLWIAAAALLAGCSGAATAPAPAAPAATEPPAAEAAPTETTAPVESAGAAEVVTWYQFDDKNEDPKNDEAVGNTYVRESIAQFDADMAGKFKLVNQPQPFNKMTTALIAAVQAGGEVPDVMQSGLDTMPLFLKNEALEDLTDWAKAQPWFASLDANALAGCTGPDGRIYCIPGAVTAHAVYYWKDHFPAGFPKTPEDFLTQAEALKQKNVYAITFFGNGTVFDGDATSRMFWMITSSYGGKWDDGQGRMLLNTPENVEAIKMLRTIVEKGYSSEDVFLGDFKEENKFKTSEAASFPTGVFVYRYLQPLKSPTGKEFGKDFDPTGGPMKDAVAAGDMQVAPMFAPAGKTPGCNANASTLIVPKGAKNLAGAQAYINWVLTQPNYSKWVKTVGGGAPALKSGYEDPEFGVPYYTETAKATEGHCRPWNGSLVDVASARKIIAGVYFDLIKGAEAQNPDIAAVLTRAQEEYNKLLESN